MEGGTNVLSPSQKIRVYRDPVRLTSSLLLLFANASPPDPCHSSLLGRGAYKSFKGSLAPARPSSSSSSKASSRTVFRSNCVPPELRFSPPPNSTWQPTVFSSPWKTPHPRCSPGTRLSRASLASYPSWPGYVFWCVELLCRREAGLGVCD
jgi:hypothetical protein